MNMSKREKAGLTVFSILTALLVVSCVQSRTPPSAGITFREASAANIPAGSPAAPPAGNGNPAPPPVTDPALAPPAVPAAEIVVHVTGAVKKPGVYHLAPGARGDDALKAAGGPTGDANSDALNLAAHLEDGSQIRVPTRKEQAANSAPPLPDAYIKHDTSVAAKSEKSALVKSTSAQHSASHSGHSGREGGGKLKAGDSATVNINTASAEALQKLPGIGPSMAERILDYRKTSGGFKSPEELMEVSGIGPKKFEKMQPFVRVK